MISANKIPFIACNGQQSGNNNNQNNNDWNNNNNQNNNQNTQAEQPVTYPTLVQNIKNKDVYRIVNKKSGKVMALSSNNEVKQATRDENKKEQYVRLIETNGLYFMQMYESKNVLTKQVREQRRNFGNCRA